uniref:Arrestin C-terminal-like domain-containing protein n=1 Tax=Grammatophora oceanica TaxID=210454 RepID=A0A7S1VDU3_9STRA|eukprot:CAMPEP_0194049110 /NCGR_PEP_ID=MMETSP0009_2-20130614/29688_1 /TAXON_ID=210454 /ORGANISM="Grammatophora oceanica, Strain CCMP 410" /LENGTH=399 /DNA_ID=CAMNT_0038695183 /DNA_START=41 /DNA_END=1240 /DNA_ORIENTATION=+
MVGRIPFDVTIMPLDLSGSFRMSTTNETQQFEGVAGAPLSGTIHLDMAEAMPKKTTGNHRITIQLVGREITGNRDGKTTRIEEHNIYKDEVVLKELNRIDAKSYFFAFTFDLPKSLPTSFDRVDLTKSTCKIDYKLVFAINGKHKVLKNVSMRGVIAEAIKPFQVQPRSQIRNPLGLGKGNAGEVSLHVTVSDTQVDRGDVVNVSIAYHNSSLKLKIQDVTVKLVEHRWVEAKGTDESENKELLAVKERLPNLTRKDVQKSSASSSSSSSASSVSDSSEDSPQPHDMDGAIAAQFVPEGEVLGYGSITVKVPEATMDTYSGKLISVSHSLKVKLRTPAFMENPSVTIPLTICKQEESPRKRLRDPAWAEEEKCEEEEPRDRFCSWDSANIPFSMTKGWQ